MRSALLVLLVASVLPRSAFAQLPDVEEGVTFEALPSLWRQVLVNHSASRLVAFHAPFRCPKGGPVVIYDSILYSGNREVGAGESVEIDIGDPSRCSGHVDAAIFSDGRAEGDPQVLGDIYAARRGAYRALGEATRVLNSIPSEHQSIEHAVDALTAKKQTALSETTASGAGYRFVLSVALDALTDPHRVNPALPSDNRGQKLPAVEDVMSTTGLSREEARAIVFSKRLEGWKSLLENNLAGGPPF